MTAYASASAEKVGRSQAGPQEPKSEDIIVMEQFVTPYMRLERQATSAEAKVEDYRHRVEVCRWEQCRLAFEATVSGTWTQVAFSAEVGKSATTIKRQVAAWRAYGSQATQPSYAEAMAGAVGTTVDAENGRKRLSTARAVMADPDVMRELLADPRVRLATTKALRTAPAERDGASTNGHSTAGDDLIVALGRQVRRLNADRRDGKVTSRDVHKITRRLRALAEVLDRIASEPLDDDELERLVRVEVFGRPATVRARSRAA